MAENAAIKQRGKPFPKGKSGNPAGKAPGTRHKATQAALALLEGEGEALTRKAVQMALAGDTSAATAAAAAQASPADASAATASAAAARLARGGSSGGMLPARGRSP